MVHGYSTGEAMQQLKTEGAIYLYRGILPPLMQKSTSSAIMFGTYFQYTRLLSDMIEAKKSNVSNLWIVMVLHCYSVCENTITLLQSFLEICAEKACKVKFRNFHIAVWM